MIHLPEIGAENRYQKTGIPVSGASDMQFGTEFFRYQFSVTNRTCCIFVLVYGTCSRVWVFGADFWYVCHGH